MKEKTELGGRLSFWAIVRTIPSGTPPQTKTMPTITDISRLVHPNDVLSLRAHRAM